MTMFLAPYTAIADIDGSPLDAGFLFFGESGKNPESFPIPIYWDADFTIPAAQPIRTRNGYPIRNGSPCKIYLKQAEHSLVIKNKNLSAILVEMNNKGISSSMLIRPNGQSVETTLSDIYSDLSDKQQQIDEKPSQQYVDEELDLKAPKETTYTKLEVNTALSLKAPQATTYTKAEVDTTFAAYVGGRKAFTTLALAQAAQSSLPANTAIEVTNDGANNGTYQWNGTTLTKSAYDPLTQSKKYIDEKTKFVSGYRGVNIADLSDALDGFYVSYEDGAIGTNPEFILTNYLEISGGVEYKVPYNYNQQFAFYDENKAFISGLASANSERKFTTPSNAKYIRLSIRDEQVENFMLAKASEYPPIYTPYNINLKALTVNTDQVNNLFTDVRNDLGVKHVNIIDATKAQAGRYISYLDGSVGINPDFYATDLCPVKPNTEYQTSSSYNQQFAFYDKNKTYISGLPYPTNSKFTTPANADYVAFSVPNEQLNTLVVSESSIFPDGYEPHSSKIIEGLVTSAKTTEIFVSADTNDTSADFTGKNAIQLALDSITDASEQNRYRIIAKGIFKVDKASDYIGYRGYPSMILAKDNVEIVGDGNTVVSAELPYNDADIGLSVDGGNYPRIQYQTLYTYAENALIKGIKFIAKNIRYAIHLDNPNGANKRHDFKDVSFIFKGNKGSQQALGVGTSTGEETYFNGGSCHSDVGVPFYCHNNSKFSKRSLVSFKSYTFSSNENKWAISLHNDGSLVKDEIELIGCSFGGSAYVIQYGDLWLKKNTSQEYDSFDHAEWTFTGYGNEPFLFNNSVGGDSLRFKTNGAGNGTSIRFDTSSSAFPLLIKNNQSNPVNLYVDGREYIDGYIVQDGSIGLQAFAFGCLDLSASAGAYDNGVVYTSMGKRLGDCSAINKTLGVYVNGVLNTITFNKNYTNMSNSDILSEMISQISGCSVSFFSYGRDYYPMMSDVTEVVYNSTTSPIQKGALVAKSGGSIRLAQTGDKVYGVALDDIPVVQTTAEGVKKGQGRIMKRGYIYADWTKPHFVLSDIHRPAVGSKFKVVNGQLVSDVNGNIGVDIDDAVISINC